MLIELRIENFAVIERLSVRLDHGLNVLTGETGAGKSIIVGALSLLLGERASAEAVRAGADRAVVEGLPDDVTTAMHVCRGNNQSRYVCEGPLDPVADTMRSEPAIVAGLAHATLGPTPVDWRSLADDYDRIEHVLNLKDVVRYKLTGELALELSDATAPELIEELKDYRMVVYRDGQWRPARWTSSRDLVRMDFGGAFGVQTCTPMWLEEMAAVPEAYPSIRETGFFVGGFNPFVDYVVLPLAMGALRLWPSGAVRPMGRLMAWGLRTFSRPPYGTLLKLEASGLKDGRPASVEVLLAHDDGYAFTAIPVAACLLQYLDGTIRRPGLHLQATLVEPDVPAPPRFLPEYDNVLLGHADRSRFFLEGVIPEGWRGNVMIDGVFSGSWKLHRSRNAARLEVSVLRPIRKLEAAAVEEEGGRLLAFAHPGAAEPEVVLRLGP